MLGYLVTLTVEKTVQSLQSIEILFDLLRDATPSIKKSKPGPIFMFNFNTETAFNIAKKLGNIISFIFAKKRVYSK